MKVFENCEMTQLKMPVFSGATAAPLSANVIAYYPCAELPEKNKALPSALTNSRSQLRAGIGPVVITGGKLDIPNSGGSGTYRAYLDLGGILNNISNLDEYSILYKFTPGSWPTLNSYAFLQMNSASSPFGLVLNESTASNIRVHTGITTYSAFVDTATAPFTGGVESNVCITLRDNAGTQTIAVTIDGTNILNWTSFTNVNNFTGLQLGYHGLYRDIYVLNTGVTDAEAADIFTSTFS